MVRQPRKATDHGQATNIGLLRNDGMPGTAGALSSQKKVSKRIKNGLLDRQSILISPEGRLLAWSNCPDAAWFPDAAGCEGIELDPYSSNTHCNQPLKSFRKTKIFELEFFFLRKRATEYFIMTHSAMMF